MNELMILNEENKEVKSYAIYYTINERFYVIYTSKEKDENNYIVLHIAKVLKEVNNTPEGIVPTGKYIGLEISDQSEWDNAKINIGEIVANKQNNTPTSVSYLPVSEISGISIKSSKTFKLREDVVDSIIVAQEEVAAPVEETPIVASVEEPAASSIEEPVVESVEDIAPVAIDDEPIAEPTIESAVENDISELNIAEPAIEDVAPVAQEEVVAAPAIAPNPFEMQPEIEIPQPVVAEEEPKINPYEVMQQQRAEEMVNNLANDNMQDIVVAPVIPVSELENKVTEEAPTPAPAVEPIEEAAPVVAPEIQPVEVESAAEVAPVQETNEEVAPVEEEPEVISSESFVDSIVADVSDILDKKEEPSAEEKEDYERLYNDALEKTVELEKELAELHNKLNNIKNIIE